MVFQNGAGAVTKDYGAINGNVTLGIAGAAAGSGGSLGGNYGTIAGSLTNNSGNVAPGDPAILTVLGDYTQGSTGTLTIDIFGNGGPGKNFPVAGNDELVVGGTATLGGTLDIVFKPGVSGTFEILDALAIDGKFGTIREQLYGQSSWIIVSGGAFNYSNGIFSGAAPAATPEPSSLLALAIPAVGFATRRRNKRQASRLLSGQ